MTNNPEMVALEERVRKLEQQVKQLLGVIGDGADIRRMKQAIQDVEDLKAR